jgi:hypothetical protein
VIYRFNITEGINDEAGSPSKEEPLKVTEERPTTSLSVQKQREVVYSLIDPNENVPPKKIRLSQILNNPRVILEEYIADVLQKKKLDETQIREQMYRLAEPSMFPVIETYLPDTLIKLKKEGFLRVEIN